MCGLKSVQLAVLDHVLRKKKIHCITDQGTFPSMLGGVNPPISLYLFWIAALIVISRDRTRSWVPHVHKVNVFDSSHAGLWPSHVLWLLCGREKGSALGKVSLRLWK